MKKCPTCEKTFDDNLRFCQLDGTPLVDASESATSDPFKTMVSGQSGVNAPPVDPFATMVGMPPMKKDDDILQLPDEPDSQKTQVISHDEASGNAPSAPPSPFDIFASEKQSDNQSSQSAGDAPLEIPRANDSSLNPPSFGDLSSTPSESANNTSDSTMILDSGATSGENRSTNQPSSSPFDAPQSQQTPSPASYKEPEQTFGAPNNPFNQSPFDQPQTPFGQQASYNPPFQQNEWTPPPAPVSNWQDQGLGANTPFQPPVAGQGQNQTLAIVSLVSGILGLCCGVLGIVALITGFMAKNNADSNPAEYGGRGMAVAGMILGGISVFLMIIGIIINFLGLLAR